MISRTDIEGAIRADPARAEQALLALQFGDQAPVTMEAARPVAQLYGMSLEGVLALQLETRGLLDTYGAALAARGAQVGPAEEPEASPEEQRIQNFGAFEPIGKAAACRIVRGADITGSGCLIGPSLVLTAWHVVASDGPDAADPVREPISVILADGARHSVSKVGRYMSPCTPEEFASGFPANDAAFADRHDVALLRLRRPEGARLNFLRVPDAPPVLRRRAGLFVLDFPEGRPRGWGLGHVTPITGIQARVQHDSDSNGGSSGAACLNTRYELIGIHQGRWPPARRLVPLARFHAPLVQQVLADVAPRFLWSLGDSLDSPLVIGRDLFFEGLAEASRSGARVRGLRVMRMNPSAGTAGLSFSATLLKAVLDRDPSRHLLIRVGFDQAQQDLLATIRQKVVDAGLRLDAEDARFGMRAGDTTPEAAMGDQARRLTLDLDAATGPDRLLWFFFENPSAGLTDSERLAFEAFVSAAFKQPRLRLVIAGFETISTPGGDEFSDADAGASAAAPGLIVDYIGRFSRSEVRTLVERVDKALDLELGETGINHILNAALENIPARNGYFDAADSAEVAARLADRLRDWRRVREAGR